MGFLSRVLPLRAIPKHYAYPLVSNHWKGLSWTVQYVIYLKSLTGSGMLIKPWVMERYGVLMDQKQRTAHLKALWHQRNKERRRQAIRLRRSTKRQYVHDLKEGKSCLDCGIEYPPYVYDFDHLPQFEKSFPLSSTGMRDKTMEEIIAEVDKCELICANCHRHRTYMRSIGTIWLTWKFLIPFKPL